MTARLVQVPLIGVGFFATVLLLSGGCWWTCSCPSPEHYTFEDQLEMTLIDVHQYDAEWNNIQWEESSWSDVLEATLSKDGDRVTFTYTTPESIFKVDFSAIKE